ncbi:hypothetical protein [Bradyrhizobium sp. STM 3562]|uniref:hypothetical protein n=1 Tax=Bradyrhizobium sp. STM 3562 TaxID=578924 RepID=UPI00388E8C2F
MMQGERRQKMSAESVIYYLNRQPEEDPVEETEWLFSALGQYTGAELRELLYVAQEPDFFELMRGLFGLSDGSRAALQSFLTATDPRSTRVTIDADGRCILHRDTLEPKAKPPLKIVS